MGYLCDHIFQVSGHVWYLIVSIPDFCILLYLCLIKKTGTVHLATVQFASKAQSSTRFEHGLIHKKD